MPARKSVCFVQKGNQITWVVQDTSDARLTFAAMSEPSIIDATASSGKKKAIIGNVMRT